MQTPDTAGNDSTPNVTYQGFSDLGLNADVVAGLAGLPFDTPTDVQVQLVPKILAGQDCLVRVRSGAGKTNAYVLPIVQAIEPGGGLQALILLPTRAIASRIQRSFRHFTEPRGIQTAAAAGGRHPAEDHADTAPEILIATPRRARDLIEEKPQSWRAGLKILIVDELDALLDSGNAAALDAIFEQLDRQRQTIFLTADLTEEIRGLADHTLRSHTLVEAASGAPAIETRDQAYFLVDEHDRFDTLVAYYTNENPRLGLLFASSEHAARELVEHLRRARVPSRWIDQRGGRPRPQEGGPKRRRHVSNELIVTCDPAQRRLSTIPASILLHYDLPSDANTYAERLQQCDRLQKRGISIAFVQTEQQDLLREIESLAKKELRRLEPPKRTRRSQPRERPPADRQDTPDPPAAPAAPAAIDDQPADASAPLPKTLGGRHRARTRKKRFWS